MSEWTNSANFLFQEALRQDTRERTKEPNLDLKGYLLNAYIHPVFKDEDDDDSLSAENEKELETILVPTKRQSRRNTPVPSKYNGSSSPSLADAVLDQQLWAAALCVYSCHHAQVGILCN